MGNPSISTQLHNGTATERRIDPHNGILAYIGATFIVEGSRQFPPAGQDQQANPERQAVVDVPDLGPVMITYRLNNYRHRRSSRWHWLAVRADAVRTDPAPLAAPPAE
ncbi:MAG: hypothetical protein EOO29_37340 [Comamonadaceae bacterium]|nr:MAG: hypothetical protein EOO29_37340 [Comamonadaceae bacterium]